MSREGWESVVLDWNFSWEKLLKCNFRVKLFQWGRVGKCCVGLELSLGGVATMHFRVSFVQGGVGKRGFRLEQFLERVAKTVLDKSFSREGWENVVLDWDVSREGLLKCNFGVGLFQGGMGKRSFKL